ncbi:MAG: FtsX-like permease family protein [Myxococcales bacterium]|nr:MAG: FtsX-like permease family protein [Myxococcales bacterium]
MVKAIDRKLIRDCRRLIGQIASIALVVASGVASYCAVQSTYRSLQQSRREYYSRFAFADAFLSLKRAPEQLKESFDRLAGVSFSDTRVVELASLPMPGMDEPASASLVSLPEHGQATINRVHIKDGHYPAVGSDEVLLFETFAKAHHLKTGDHLSVVLRGMKRELRIAGLAMSPEFLFPMSPTEMMPDEKRFAVLWMRRDALAAMSDMRGAFNDVVFRLGQGVDRDALKGKVDRLTERYGGFGLYYRDKQISNKYLEQELEQLRGMATVVPTIFLLVAAFLLNMVLSRLVATQRAQIATLRALGYGVWQLLRHYLLFVLLVVTLGSLAGVLVGAWLGYELTNLYSHYFHFPALRFSLGTDLVLLSVWVSLLAGTVGALSAVWKVIQLPPAEAMRPAAPTRYRRRFWDYISVLLMLNQSSRMVIRELSRRPWRTLFSTAAIASAIAISVAGRFSYDAIYFLMDQYFPSYLREDVTVTFSEPASKDALDYIRAIPGVQQVEGSRALAARFRSKHYLREAVVYSVGKRDTLRPVLAWPIEEKHIPAHGIVLGRKLAEILHVQLGQSVALEVLEGDRQKFEVQVSAYVNDLIGLQAYIDQQVLARLLDERPRYSGASLLINQSQYKEVMSDLKAIPGVYKVFTPDSIFKRFRNKAEA